MKYILVEDPFTGTLEEMAVYDEDSDEKSSDKKNSDEPQEKK